MRGFAPSHFCLLEAVFCQQIDAICVSLQAIHIFAVGVEVLGAENESWSQVPEYVTKDILTLLVHIVAVDAVLLSYGNG